MIATTNNTIGTTTNTWRSVLPITLIALLALLVFYWQTAVSMAAIWWRSDTYAHGMVVLPIVAYMIWWRRHQLATLAPQISHLGLVLLLFLSLGWLIAHSADVLVVQQFLLVAMVPVLCYALLGRSVVWALSFPLVYLFFAVPVGEALIPPLQHFTAFFTVKALQWTGIPVLLENFYITIPSKNNPMNWDRFLVAEACSGSRYLFAALAIGCLYAYLSYRSWWRRTAFIILAIVFPIFANGVRAYGIVMIAHHSGMKYATGVDHLIYGWLFFGVVIALLFWIGSWWREPQATPDSVAFSAPSTMASSASPNNFSFSVQAAIAVILATSGSLVASWLNSNTPSASSVALTPPQLQAPWSALENKSADWQPEFVGADAVLQRSYQLDQKTIVYLYIAFYQQERQDAELINSQNRIYNDEFWKYNGSATISTAYGQRQVTLLQNTAHKRLIWHWYRVAGIDTISPVIAKLLRAWDQLTGLHKGSVLIAIATDYEIDRKQAAETLNQFLEFLQPELDNILKPIATEQ